jgi:hypothetical protein
MIELTRAKELRDFIFRDPTVRQLYAQGDQLSSSQTKHDEGHAFQVLAVGKALVREIHKRMPLMFDEYTREIVIPIAAFLHDVGRAINVDEHASAGAKWAKGYLTGLGFDRTTVRSICRIIACHRSSVVLKPKSFSAPDYKDAAWAIVVIADKAVGDEDRVRPEPLKELRRLRQKRRMHEFAGSKHDLVNYAIKGAALTVDGRDDLADPGAIVLKLKIDKVVCQPADIYGLYLDRFHACGKAAQYMGFLFRLEFNGVRYAFSKEKQEWQPVATIPVSGKSH